MMHLDHARRAAAKSASRSNDAVRIASGEISRAALSAENGILDRERLRGVRLIRDGNRRLKVPRVLVS